MKQRPVSLLWIVQTLGLGALLHLGNAQAIPESLYPDVIDNPPGEQPASPSLADTEPTAQVTDTDDAGTLLNTCRNEPAARLDDDTASTAIPCAQSADSSQRFSIQMGQRMSDDSRILGRFDGVRMNYRLADGLNLNGIAGFRALDGSDALNPSRQVYGISAAMDPSARTWDLSSYFMEQQENGLTLGRSAGGAIRHMRPGRSMLVYLDYDVARSTIGTLMTSGAWKLPYSTTISATVNRHSCPIPPHQKDYLSQSMAATPGWYWIVPTDRLTHYTENHDYQVNILAGSLSHALNRRIQFSSDVVVLNARDDNDTESDSSEYFYHLKLSGKNLFTHGDRSKIDLRHTSTADGETSSASIDTRFSLKHFWSLVSRLGAEHVRPSPESQARWIASPKVKVEYRPSKQFGFHLEAGGNLLGNNQASEETTLPSYFVSLGYQVNF